ncbi:MAG: hypothetical protein HND56_10915 [Pseudomonadota bacterium]|nr:hypothetical protein [Pseudomonadota bacterium]QKK06164.1 MAG: hypothetical protein HND56_10915 [Pseudomonadota bacterium]
MKKLAIIALMIITAFANTVFLYAANSDEPNEIYALTEAQKAKIDKAYNAADIVVLGTVHDSSVPEDEFRHPAIEVEEIFKLPAGATILVSQQMPILFNYPDGVDYFREKESFGKKYIIYGRGTSSIVVDRAYEVARQEYIQKAKADLVFLGRFVSSFSWNDKDKDDDGHLFYTMPITPIRILKDQSKDWQTVKKDQPILVRFSRPHGKENRIYKLAWWRIWHEHVVITDARETFWISADKIPGTDYYDAEFLGTEMTATIDYLRQKHEEQ